jgi:hypothetical protein
MFNFDREAFPRKLIFDPGTREPVNYRDDFDRDAQSSILDGPKNQTKQNSKNKSPPAAFKHVAISVSVLPSCTTILDLKPVAHPFRGEAFSSFLKYSAGFYASPHSSNLWLGFQG